MRRVLLMMALMIIAVAGGMTQTTTRTPGFTRERGVGIFGGYSLPLGRGGFTEYWQPGPEAGLELTTRVSRQFSLGIGFNAAAYWFREGKFSAAHPGVSTHNISIALIGVELIGRLELLPARKTAPYFGFSLGVVHMTGALYEALINSVRVTYFDLPMRNRLTFGLNAGVEFHLSRVVAIDTEAKFLYVNNDPNVSWTVTPCAGLRFLF